MRAKIGPMLMEARSIVRALRANLDVHLGPVLVSGTLSEQLARELAAGAGPGAVVAAHGSRPGAAALVHVIAGEPAPADDELVRRADRQGVPVVLVQLEPRASGSSRSCSRRSSSSAGRARASRFPRSPRSVVDATEYPVALARRVPVLREAVTEAVLGTAAIRAAIIGALGARSKGTRPILALEQVRMLGELRAADDPACGRRCAAGDPGHLGGYARRGPRFSRCSPQCSCRAPGSRWSARPSRPRARGPSARRTGAWKRTSPPRKRCTDQCHANGGRRPALPAGRPVAIVPCHAAKKGAVGERWFPHADGFPHAVSSEAGPRIRRGSEPWEERCRTRSWPRSCFSSRKPTRGSSTSSRRGGRPRRGMGS